MLASDGSLPGPSTVALGGALKVGGASTSEALIQAPTAADAACTLTCKAHLPIGQMGRGPIIM
jgi:hypothetical protein